MTAPHVLADDAFVVDWYARTRNRCLARLWESRDPATGLFSRQLRNGDWGPTHGAEAVTSTAISLIALGRLGADFPSREETARSLGALAENVRASGYHGALGLALWANAAAGGVNFSRFLAACGVAEGDLDSVMQRASTMELAWLLSGLLHERLRAPTPALDRLSRQARDTLLARQRPTGLFAHAGQEARFARRIRRHVATFADQIYAVLALSHAAIAHGEEASLPARRCADALLALQGPRHQWWWHYKPDRGAVSRHYPVYAVHQHGMAPIAFLTLAASGAEAYRQSGWPGLEWIWKNEIGRDLLDSVAGTIWRDVHVARGRVGTSLRDIRELAGIAADTGTETGLVLNRETRPYEWAWCLMADALLTSTRSPRHLA